MNPWDVEKKNRENLRDWPFPERRYPSSDNPDHLGPKGLSLTVQGAVASELAGKKNLKILDVGCGQKPFYPFFEPIAGEYIGTDIIERLLS